MEHYEKKVAPHKIMKGSITSDGQHVYLSSAGKNSLYKYQFATEEWETLPSCPYRDSGLVIINGELVTVGGCDQFHITNQILTLRLNRWVVDEYPRMINARSSPAVVTTCDSNYLIVVGGMGSEEGWMTTVEIFQLKNKIWRETTPLPQPLCFPSVTVCGNELNVIGSETHGYFCSLQNLTSFSLPWTPLPTLPVKYSVAASLCGQLILVGGEREFSSVNSIHQLYDGQWVEIGCTSKKRNMCVTANTSPDKILIFGGNGQEADVVESCVVV